jgi:hypothetical protein
VALITVSLASDRSFETANLAGSLGSTRQKDETMSLQSVTASAQRASAAIKATAQHAIAKRGMFAMIERRHSYTSLLHGAYAGYVGFTPCLVANVTRDGIVKEVTIAGQSWPLKRRDWQYVTVDSAGRIADPESVVRRLVDETGRAIEYHSHNEAVAAIKAAAGIEQ